MILTPDLKRQYDQTTFESYKSNKPTAYRAMTDRFISNSAYAPLENTCNTDQTAQQVHRLDAISINGLSLLLYNPIVVFQIPICKKEQKKVYYV